LAESKSILKLYLIDNIAAEITLPIKSKVQFSRIVFYWAVLTVGFALLWSFILNLLHMSGMIPALSLAGPMILGGISSVLLYFARDHRTLEYDDDGYRVRKGKLDLASHRWSEFKECSVVKDSYGRNRIRVYVDRDGNHFDIESSACGVDPYNLRDFALSRISPRVPEERASNVFTGLERELQRGRAGWVADLNETFRDYQLAGEVFPLIARGGTRPKGFLLSRFIAFTIMPNYNVCMYVDRLDSGKDAKGQILRLIRIVETQRDQKDIKWSWLLLLGDGEPPELAGRLIKEFGNKDVGIGYVNILTGEMLTSANQLGRSMFNQMRLNHLIRDLRKRKYLSY